MVVSVDVSINLKEGDQIKFNDHVWEVEEIGTGIEYPITHLRPLTGAGQTLRFEDMDEFAKYIDFSGEVHLIRKDYTDIIEF